MKCDFKDSPSIDELNKIKFESDQAKQLIIGKIVNGRVYKALEEFKVWQEEMQRQIEDPELDVHDFVLARQEEKVRFKFKFF